MRISMKLYQIQLSNYRMITYMKNGEFYGRIMEIQRKA